MDIDLDLYRHEVRVSTSPLVRLSAMGISPDHPQRTFVFIYYVLWLNRACSHMQILLAFLR
jgi:hypothetical protein